MVTDMLNAAALDHQTESAEGWNVMPPTKRPVAIGGMSRAALDCELTKGVDSLHDGNGMTPDEVDAALAREFGR